MAEIVVYKQQELLKALDNDIKEIILCAGFFEIPKAENTVFKHIGPVKVSVLCTMREAEAVGMEFEGIFPTYKREYAIESRASMAVVALSGGGVNSGSYVSSGSYGSYGSYSSYITSFASSYVSSFGSYGSYGSSYNSSYSSSFITSFNSSLGSYNSFCLYKGEIINTCEVVFGYGINLI